MDGFALTIAPTPIEAAADSAAGSELNVSASGQQVETVFASTTLDSGASSQVLEEENI